MLTVFGSINLDLLCRVPRLPGEGETLRMTALQTMPGGKGANQAVAAARAGAKVRMIGAVGQDAAATEALSGLVASGVDLSGVARIEDQPTGTAIVLVEPGGDNRILIAAGANDHVIMLDADQDGWLLLQMEVPVDRLAQAIDSATASGQKVMLNLAPAAPFPRASLEKLTLLVVNEGEATELSLQLGCAATAEALSEALGTTVLRTLGGAGAECCGPMTSGVLVTAAAPSIRPVDTTAAGDTFIGFLAAALDAGQPIGAAMERAVRAGALTCLTRGSQQSIPDAAALDAATFEQESLDA